MLAQTFYTLNFWCFPKCSRLFWFQQKRRKGFLLLLFTRKGAGFLPQGAQHLCIKGSHLSSCYSKLSGDRSGAGSWTPRLVPTAVSALAPSTALQPLRALPDHSSHTPATLKMTRHTKNKVRITIAIKLVKDQEATAPEILITLSLFYVKVQLYLTESGRKDLLEEVKD